MSSSLFNFVRCFKSSETLDLIDIQDHFQIDLLKLKVLNIIQFISEIPAPPPMYWILHRWDKPPYIHLNLFHYFRPTETKITLDWVVKSKFTWTLQIVGTRDESSNRKLSTISNPINFLRYLRRFVIWSTFLRTQVIGNSISFPRDNNDNFSKQSLYLFVLNDSLAHFFDPTIEKRPSRGEIISEVSVLQVPLHFFGKRIWFRKTIWKVIRNIFPRREYDITPIKLYKRSLDHKIWYPCSNVSWKWRYSVLAYDTNSLIYSPCDSG